MGETEIIINTLGALSYGGLFIFFLMVNSLMPFPEEVFILALGYIGSAGLVNMYLAGALAFIGLFISDIVLYSLIRGGNKFLVGWGKNLMGEDFFRHEVFLRKHLKKIVFLTRFFIGIRFLGPFIAGTLKMKRSVFILYDGAALFIFILMLIFIGNYFHAQFEVIISGLNVLKFGIFFILIILFFLFISRYFRRNIIKKLLGHQYKFHRKEHKQAPKQKDI